MKIKFDLKKHFRIINENVFIIEITKNPLFIYILCFHTAVSFNLRLIEVNNTLNTVYTHFRI